MPVATSYQDTSRVLLRVTTMNYSAEADIEKNPGVDDVSQDTSVGTVEGKPSRYGVSLPAKVRRLAGKVKTEQDGIDPPFEEEGGSLSAKFRRFVRNLNVEQRGIERVPEDERTPTSYYNIGSMVCHLHPPLISTLAPCV